jgi:hypothetical protein
VRKKTALGFAIAETDSLLRAQGANVRLVLRDGREMHVRVARALDKTGTAWVCAWGTTDAFEVRLSDVRATASRVVRWEEMARIAETQRRQARKGAA